MKKIYKNVSGLRNGHNKLANLAMYMSFENLIPKAMFGKKDKNE